MNFKTLSRRDDLISLTYLMIFIRKGHLDFLKCLNYEIDQYKIFKYVSKAKNKMSPEELCQDADTQVFLEFVKTVHQMEFEEQPDYEYLEKLLMKIIEENR